jgi:hypothetical protein
MRFIAKGKRSAFFAMSLIIASCAAFTTSPLPLSFSPSTRTMIARRPVVAATVYKNNKPFLLHASNQEEVDDEIERLKQMAAKLRAEAASLEAEQQQAMAQAAEKAFQKVCIIATDAIQMLILGYTLYKPSENTSHHSNLSFAFLHSLSLILITMGK